MYRVLKVPMNVQFEITSKCNEKCIHCYNYWRCETDSTYMGNMSKDLFDKCFNELEKHNVLHVIFTGGEPLLNFDILTYGISRASKIMSVSCNSNLLLANKNKLKILKDVGLLHILTSLNSYNPDTNDFMVSRKGSFNKIVKNINYAINIGINISSNMIISDANINDIYNTAKFAYNLGISKFHVTRVIPPSYIKGDYIKQFTIDNDKLDIILNQISKINDDFPIKVKTLIPYPLCALKNLNKYKDLVGRPCAGGKRSISIDSKGFAHACWHMGENFGNVAEEGLDVIWKKMQKWRNGELIPKECISCPFLKLCGSGCRVSGEIFNGNLDKCDNLRIGWDKIEKKYTGNIGVDDSITDIEDIFKLYETSFTEEILRKCEFSNFKLNDINIRDENGFSIIQLKAGTSFFLEEKYVNMIRKMNGVFNLYVFGKEYLKFFAYLLTKNVIKDI